MDERCAVYDRLVRLDPAAHVVASYSRALVYMYMGQFDETFRQLEHAGDADNALVRTFRALALYYTGQTDAAAELMKTWSTKHPNMHGIRPFLAMFSERAGQARRGARAAHARVKRNGEVDADISYSIGSVYALEGLPAMLSNGSSVRSRLAMRNRLFRERSELGVGARGSTIR
jgi:tetratricopeptide (TPR) repeat protein